MRPRAARRTNRRCRPRPAGDPDPSASATAEAHRRLERSGLRPVRLSPDRPGLLSAAVRVSRPPGRRGAGRVGRRAETTTTRASDAREKGWPAEASVSPETRAGRPLGGGDRSWVRPGAPLADRSRAASPVDRAGGQERPLTGLPPVWRTARPGLRRRASAPRRGRQIRRERLAGPGLGATVVRPSTHSPSTPERALQ